MKPISNVQPPLILRSDFSDNAVWEQICRILNEPILGHDEPLNYVNDPQYEGITIPLLFSIIPDPKGSGLFEIFIVDATTISDPTHPLLIVDLVGDPGYTKPGRYTRVTADWVRDVLIQFDLSQYSKVVQKGSRMSGYEQTNRLYPDRRSIDGA